MGTEDQPDTGIKKKKSTTYFTIASLFFLGMALLWSVDASLVYICLGAACFFLFLGFYSYPVKKDPVHTYKKSYQEEKKDFSAGPSFGDSLRNFIQRKKYEFSSGGSSTVPASRKIVVIVMVTIFVMFMIPTLVAIFGSGSESYDALNYYAEAEQQYSSQQYDSAYLNYKRALQLQPEYAEAMVGYGNVLIIRNENDSAILMFDKALEINPDYKEAAYDKAFVFYNQKKYNEGISLLTPLIESNPDYYDAKFLLGDCYYTQKKYDDAIVWYENVYQNADMRSRVLCHLMAYIYDTKGEYDKAIAFYQEALTYDSSVVEIYQRLGELIPGENGNIYRTKAAELKQ